MSTNIISNLIISDTRVSHSIFDSLSDEEKSKIGDYYSATKEMYATNQGKIKSWKGISSNIMSGNYRTEDKQRLSETVDNSTAKIFSQSYESPIMSEVLDYKTSELLKVNMIPQVMHFDKAHTQNTKQVGTDMTATNAGVSQMSQAQSEPVNTTAPGDTQSSDQRLTKSQTMDIEVKKLNRVLLTMEKQLITPDIKRWCLHNAFKEGSSVIKLTSSGDKDIKNPKDVMCRQVDISTLYYDTSQSLPHVDEIIEEGLLTKTQFDDIASIYKKTIDENYGQNPNDFVAGRLADGDTDNTYGEMYFLTNVEGGSKKQTVVKAILLNEELVDVISLPTTIIPYVSLSFGENEELWKNSLVYKSLDLLDVIIRCDTTISKLLQFAQSPQFELRVGDVKGNTQTFRVLSQTPGYLWSSKSGQAVRVIDRGGQIQEYMAVREMYKQELYQVSGLTKFNTGTSSGSITTSAGVNSMIEMANSSLACDIPAFSKFLLNSFKVLLDIILYSSSDFIYVSQNEVGKEFLDLLNSKDLGDKAKLSVSIDVVSTQVSLGQSINILSQVYGVAMNSGDPQARLNAYSILKSIINMTPMPLDEKLKLEIETSDTMMKAFKTSNETAARAGALGASSVMSQLAQNQAPTIG